jgi:hypothetical protein
MTSVEHTATGRPPERATMLQRVLSVLLASVALMEAAHYAIVQHDFAGPLRALLPHIQRAMHVYLPLRSWALGRPQLAVSIVLAAIIGVLVTYRWGLLVWHNQVVSRLSGTHFSPERLAFPSTTVNLFDEIARRPKGTTFIGMTPCKGLLGLGWRWRPVYLSQVQKSMHRHTLGKTGSGKTMSVLWPAVLQDVLDGKGCLVMDAKGSNENVEVMKGIAALAKREHELKVFCLPAWNQSLFSHTYNMVYVRPRSANDAGGDPTATAERVFNVLPLGDNLYYNVQAQVMFTNLVRLLHGMVDESGHGIPFVVKDISVCLRGIGKVELWSDALNFCLDTSVDQEAARNIRAQIQQLGRDVNKCFSGLLGALDKFQAPLVNAYQPDLIFEEVLETNALVYAQLPANLFKIQAPALGRVLLQDVQQEGSLRQVFRSTKNQRAFSVVVDEFYNFADLSIIDSLNKLRDANLEFHLAHQSVADLELVSKEFATAVWDNTRTKDVLAQNNPELCEKVSKSIGTEQTVEVTVRRQQGALFTSLTTGDASSKLVETYRLHPNAIKGLARCGQGYLMNDETLKPICYGMLPRLGGDFELRAKAPSPQIGLRLYEKFIDERSSQSAKNGSTKS